MRIIILFVILSLLVGYGVNCRAQAPQTKNVLVLHSYHPELNWTNSVMEGIAAALNKYNGNIHIYVEYMDAKRHFDEKYNELLVDLLRHKYREVALDVIVCSDDDALNFLYKYRNQLFAGVPVTFCGINVLNSALISTKNYTGVLETNDMNNTLQLALKLHPHVQNIYVISDQTVSGKIITEKFLAVTQPFKNRLRFTVIDNLPMNKLQSYLAQIPNDSIIFLLSVSRDSDGVVYTHKQFIDAIADYANVPMYSVWDFYLGRGIVGGRLTNGLANGELAGQMARRVLAGESIENIPIMRQSPYKYMFDFVQINRFGIRLADLPPDSIIINRPVSLYETDRQLFLQVAALIFGMGIIIVILTLVIRRSIRAERALHKFSDQLEERVSARTEELATANKQLRHTLSVLRQTQDQLVQSEKMAALGGLVAGLAHEINTPIGNGVTAVSFMEQKQADLAKKYQLNSLKKSDMEEFISINSEALTLIRLNLAKAVGLIQSFKKVAIDQSTEECRSFRMCEYIDDILMSLKPKLKHTGHNIIVDCDKDIVIDSYPSAISQIVTNLVLNSLTHAYEGSQQGSIKIAVIDTGDNIQLWYSDDGKGIAPALHKKIFEPFYTTKRGQGGTGLGLHIVYNIVTQKLNGTIKVDSAVGKGTQFLIIFPQNGGPNHG